MARSRAGGAEEEEEEEGQTALLQKFIKIALPTTLATHAQRFVIIDKRQQLPQQQQQQLTYATYDKSVSQSNDFDFDSSSTSTSMQTRQTPQTPQQQQQAGRVAMTVNSGTLKRLADQTNRSVATQQHQRRQQQRV